MTTGVGEVLPLILRTLGLCSVQRLLVTRIGRLADVPAYPGEPIVPGGTPRGLGHDRPTRARLGMGDAFVLPIIVNNAIEIVTYPHPPLDLPVGDPAHSDEQKTMAP